jgi:hypothetical protein
MNTWIEQKFRQVTLFKKKEEKEGRKNKSLSNFDRLVMMFDEQMILLSIRKEKMKNSNKKI